MPQVVTRLRDEFRLEPVMFKPNQAVALGASRYPFLEYELLNIKPDIHIIGDYFPFNTPFLNKSYGILGKFKDGEVGVFNFLLKNTPVNKAQFSRSFMVRDNNVASCIQFMITEGENGCYVEDSVNQERMCSVINVTIIATCILKLPVKCKAGDIVSVTFEIVRGKLLISAIYQTLNQDLNKEVHLELKADISDDFEDNFANIVIE